MKKVSSSIVKVLYTNLVFLLQISFFSYCYGVDFIPSAVSKKPDLYEKLGQYLKKNIVNKSTESTESTESFEINKTVIDISNIVKDFDKQSSCNTADWENKPENACICCLVKNAPDLSAGKKPSLILNSCVKQYSCDISTLFKAAGMPYNKKSKLSESNIRDLIVKLYQKSIVVKELSLHDIALKPNGEFTEDSAAKFLAEAFKEKKLYNKAFMNSSCLHAKDIITQKGYQTKQLFLVSSECLGKEEDFIFKEIASGREEIKRLERTFIIPELHPYFFPNKITNFPSFVLPFAYISYTYNGKDHYMSLLSRAPGVLLSSLIKQYKAKSISKEDVKKAFHETGLTLSNFHKHFMHLFKKDGRYQPGKLLNPTYLQGDAHQGNIFYDKKTNQVIFIDNERIASNSPANPFDEIVYSIFTTYDLFTPKDIIADTNFFEDWIYLSVKSFLEGYIDAYDKTKRGELLKELLEKFKNLHDGRYTKYQNVFNKIFADLKSEYGVAQ